MRVPAPALELGQRDSALALSCGEPTWFGSDAMVFIQPPISADRSLRRTAARDRRLPMHLAPSARSSELATRSAANVVEPERIARRILPPYRRSDAEDTSALLRAITKERSPLGHRQRKGRTVGDYHAANVEAAPRRGSLRMV